MMATPLVSIVIPTFNQPELLLHALHSVFAQTFSDYEVVIINDGSTDNTLEKLAPLQAEHGNQLRIITQANAGIGAARNRGIDEATGKYVALLDHDDFWKPTKLERQVQFLENRPDFVSVGACYANSTAPDVPVFCVSNVVDQRGEVRHPLRLFADGVPVVLTSFLMFNRERAQGARFAELRGAVEDVPFQIKLFARGPFGMAAEEIMGIYRLHAGNFSSNANYYYTGLKQLRSLDHSGHFGEVTGEMRGDMEYHFAQQGRMTAMRQLLAGRRARAAEIYLREWLHQARHQRIKFLAIFPFLLLLPQAVVRYAAPRG
jgi:glycosyltransferase involved in cell wall biosynthesis